MNLTFKRNTLLTVVWLITFSSHSLPATLSQASSRVVGPLHVEQFGVYSVVADISLKTHVQIGFDAVLPEKDQAIVFDFPGGTVANLLNIFVSQIHDYAWEDARDGMIYIHRKNAHTTLVDQVIYFPETSQKTGWQIWQEISSWSEITAWTTSNSCVRQGVLPGKDFRNNQAAVTIPKGQIRLRELLDKIVIQSQSNSWAVIQTPSSAQTCHVDIIFW